MGYVLTVSSNGIRHVKPHVSASPHSPPAERKFGVFDLIMTITKRGSGHHAYNICNKRESQEGKCSLQATANRSSIETYGIYVPGVDITHRNML